MHDLAISGVHWLQDARSARFHNVIGDFHREASEGFAAAFTVATHIYPQPGVVIAEPASGSMHASGWLTVSGRARGYEGTVIVSAHTAGDTPRLVDQAVVSAASMAELEPFTTRLDLRQTTKGDVIAIVVRGDTGSEDDPGEFSAVPIRIGF